MLKWIKILNLVFILILFSCSQYKGINIENRKCIHKDTAVIKIKNPIKEFNYDWEDTTIVAIELENGQWGGLVQWKNVGVCSRNSILQPIEFRLDNNTYKIESPRKFDTITADSNFPQVKLHKNYFCVWYMNNNKRILRKITINNSKVENFKFQPGSNNKFAIDQEGNFYFSDFDGIAFTLFDKIKNVFSYKINCSPKNPPIGKYNKKLNKIDSFGRWNCFDIKEKRNLYRNVLLNYRHILFSQNNLFAVSYNYGLIEKYSLTGEFISSLNLHSISPIFKNIDKTKQVQFLDMDIAGNKLFVLFGTHANVLSGIHSYPDDKNILIGIAKIDISENKMKRNAIYYLLPDDHNIYQPSFEIIDTHTVAMPKEKGIELYRLP